MMSSKIDITIGEDKVGLLRYAKHRHEAILQINNWQENSNALMGSMDKKPFERINEIRFMKFYE